MKIKKLSPHIISQIAAGEVIERPAYAVKELIENAIDAEATQISIDIEESGLKRITVSDDGIGMKKEDLLVSFLPHTTSKITTEDDIHAITSLGFRGEALSSIASISHMSIQSRHRSFISGYGIELEQGRYSNGSVIGMPVGTTVTIKELFGHVPARKKFLKTAKTEFRIILDIVSDYVLLYPHISFRFIHNNREYFTFSRRHKLDRRITALLGDSLFVNLVPIKAEESYIKISGYVSRPQYSIKGTSKLFIFVNGRRISDPLIAGAIKDAYKNLLEYGAYPITILYISVPPEMVDVNIHPRKQEVRFINPDTIYSTVMRAVTDVLNNNNLTFINVSWKDGGTKTHLGKILKTELLEDIDQIKKNTDCIQIHNVYLIAESKKGMMIVDQHAAHEAILFRKLSEMYFKKRTHQVSFQLKDPLLLDISYADREIVIEHQELFIGVGFGIEEFGESIRINSIPEILKDRNISDLIAEFIEDIRENKPLKEIDRKTYRMLSYIACRSAIKAGTYLNKRQRADLIADLIASDMTYTCPHGRPVKIEMNLNSLNKMFKR
jgi:DNA mismatch repair protein MutL